MLYAIMYVEQEKVDGIAQILRVDIGSAGRSSLKQSQIDFLDDLPDVAFVEPSMHNVMSNNGWELVNILPIYKLDEGKFYPCELHITYRFKES